VKCTISRYNDKAMGWMIGVRFLAEAGKGPFLFATASRPDLGPTQTAIKGYWEPGREADHSTLSSAEVKNEWSYIPTPPVRIHSVVLS